MFIRSTMPMPANDVPQPEPVGPLTSAYLRRCGYAEKDIASWTSGTRLLQDLRLCGDDIELFFEILHTGFGVDLTKFDFDKYFPSELSDDAYRVSIQPVLRFFGLQRVVDRVYDKYPPVTLGMIEETIKQGRWVSEPHP